MSLPKFVVLKSKYNSKYLRYINENGEVHELLQFSGEEVVSSLGKLEVVKAKTGEGLVHLRCSYNNKFLTRRTETQWWLVAGADNPEEDQSKWSCTLFKPIFVDGQSQTLRFMHVQLGHYAYLWTAREPYVSCFYAGSPNIDQDGRDVVTFVDWNSVVPNEEDSIEIGSWGGPRGGVWSFDVKGGGITKIVIRSSDKAVDAIAITGQTADGQTVQSSNFGGQGGNPSEIILDWPREYLTTISGAHGIYNDNGPRVIKWMELTTNLGKKYGPYGSTANESDTPFSFTMKRGAIVGFHGRSGSLIDAIGIYVRKV